MTSERIHYDQVMRLIVEGTAGETGEGFLRAVVKNLASALGTKGAWVTEYLPDERRLRSLAFWLDGDYVERYEYDLEHTPCQVVIEEKRLVHFPERLIDLFPDDPDLAGLEAMSYIGSPLLDGDRVLGHLAALDDRPMPVEEGLTEVFALFATRVQAERRRLAAEARVRAREQQLERLLDSAMDAILVLDGEYRVLRANPAARRVLGTSELKGADLRDFLDRRDLRIFETLIGVVARGGEAEERVWVPHSLHFRTAAGASFPAELTLSRSVDEGRDRFTLILRNVDERLEAEERIRRLTHETEWLREAALGPEDGAILGRSRAMRDVLDAIARVAETDATVLVLGETGTGKELVARELHRRSRRAKGPLVCVNCAALPANLIESELFGHEKGAFTGATVRREGRFAQADGGTLFLDEVAEFPIELQAKLLRVLQEGEFDPLGSSEPQRVDVRVVAATHRDLEARIESGEFREDLYYRLGVFPIRLPALRERGDDIELLATAIVRHLSRRMGRKAVTLTAHDLRLLRGYPWPGNVRELQNVLERALILSSGDRLALQRAMPRNVEEELTRSATADGDDSEAPVLTFADLKDLEKRSIERALRAASGKISGRGGAAELLGTRPSTLASRIKALDIERA